MLNNIDDICFEDIGNSDEGGVTSYKDKKIKFNNTSDLRVEKFLNDFFHELDHACSRDNNLGINGIKNGFDTIARNEIKTESQSAILSANRLSKGEFETVTYGYGTITSFNQILAASICVNEVELLKEQNKGASEYDKYLRSFFGDDVSNFEGYNNMLNASITRLYAEHFNKNLLEKIPGLKNYTVEDAFSILNVTIQ